MFNNINVILEELSQKVKKKADQIKSRKIFAVDKLIKLVDNFIQNNR
jgi:hypothetical protein